MQREPGMPSSFMIHWGLLAVARDVLYGAHKLAKKRDPESAFKSRCQCASVLLLLCSALEACINVYAGLHYSRAATSEAQADGWPEKWMGRRGYSTPSKWKRFAEKIAGPAFTDRAGKDWQTRIGQLFTERHELIAHFKGAWAPSDLERRYRLLSVRDIAGLFAFAREMVNALDDAFGHSRPATYFLDIGLPPSEQATRHLDIPPIGTAYSGMSVLDMPELFDDLDS